MPAGNAGLTISASDVTLQGVRIAGANRMTYNGSEYGVIAVGSPGALIQRLTIRNSDIGTFGNDAVFAKYVANLAVSGNTFHDTVYAGILVISGQGGRIEGNLVQRVGVNGAAANSNNAYGIGVTDQGGSPTSDFVVTGNTVEDVPTWHALDTHGGLRVSFTNNTVRRASRAMFVTDSGFRATDVTVSGNQFLSPAPVTFNLTAVTTYNTVRVTITGNTITGWGAGQDIEDYGNASTGLVVSNNVIVP